MKASERAERDYLALAMPSLDAQVEDDKEGG